MWGKRVDTKCPIKYWEAPSNLGHLLNWCKKSLHWFEFRHDSILTHIVQKVVFAKPETITVYADLDGWRVNRGTLPQNLPPNPKKPDIVIVDRTSKLEVLLELTCPFDSSAASFQAACDQKTLRYKRLALDCQSMVYETHKMPLEVGSGGVITAPDNTPAKTHRRQQHTDGYCDSKT